LAYISAEITNSKGELCNEGEAIYFLMNEEKAKEMGFLHCEVEFDDSQMTNEREQSQTRLSYAE
jgi:hypothetical protein